MRFWLAEHADMVFFGLLAAVVVWQIVIRLFLKLGKANPWREYADSFFIAMILATVIRSLIIQTFIIPSGSMENSLLIGDQLIVNKFIYGTKVPWRPNAVLKIREPRRGDVIVFRYPRDPKTRFVKRCIGVPGDVVEIKDKTVYINGHALEERYIHHGDPRVLASIRDNLGPFTVPEGQYFMLGDNRDYSADSRFWGLLPESLIEGKAICVYWPVPRWHLI